MSPSPKERFIDAYHKIYGIIPTIIWDGSYFRSPHLPMAMSARRFLAWVNRLELRLPSNE